MSADLAPIGRARQMLAEAKTPQDFKLAADAAEIAVRLAKTIGLKLEEQNEAAEIKLDAERGLGELLSPDRLERRERQRTDLLSACDVARSPYATTLSEIGMSRFDAHRCYLTSRIPQDRYAELKSETRAAGKELTTALMVSEAKRLIRQGANVEAASGTELEHPDIRHQDALEMIAGLEDGSVAALVTDPPYAVTENPWDVWDSADDYWDFMRAWLAAIRPKMAEDFTAFIFCDADASPMLWHVLRDGGWPVLRQAIWHRPNLAKKRAGSITFLSAYEPFWHCGTRALLMPEQWGGERFDVQKFAVPQDTHLEDKSWHPTQKPLALMERLVELSAHPSELVVDPFCGAGTTAVAAAKLGRRCITSDTDAGYVAIARARVMEITHV